MLKFILHLSIQYRYLIIAIAGILTLLGVFCAARMPIDVLPDLNRPTVVLLAEAHDLTPELTALQVALPLERSMSGVPNVERVSSQTGKGMTVIKVEFPWGSDIYRNRQIVQEKLSEVKLLLPEEVNLQMAPISSIMGQIQLIGLTSKSGETPLEEIRLLADNRIKYDLLSLPGIAKVIVVGGAPKQLTVAADPLKLRAYGVTLDELNQAVINANLSTSGGLLDMGASAPMITFSGAITSTQSLADALIKTVNGRPIKISDVADIQFAPAQIRTGEAGVNGKEGVILVIMKQPGADTVEISKKLDERFTQLGKNINPDIEICLDLFSQRLFIERALDNLLSAVRDGALMVVVILFIFLMNWRTTVITLTAIPVSIAITAIVFAFFGFTINTMTLGGLAVGMGSLVDSAIVDVENSFRRLRQNKAKPKGEQKNPMQVVFDASFEVRGAVVMATLLVVIVYLPLFFLSGMEGRLFIPIGLAYMISMGASLIVAMTLTVALCATLLPNHLPETERESWIVRILKPQIRKLIIWSVDHAKSVLIIFTILTIGAIGILASSSTAFLPEFNEGVAQVNLVLPPETSLKNASEIGRQAEQLLMEIQGVKTLSRRTGRAEEDEHAHGVNASDIIISFDESVQRSREEILSEVREQLEHHFPGVLVAVEQPLAHLISAMLSGVKAQVAIKIYGPDFPQLYQLATEVEAALKPIKGIKDLQIEQQKLIPVVDIVPNRPLMAQYGLFNTDLANTVALALGEDPSTYFFQDRTRYNVVVRLKNEYKKSIQDLEQLLVRNNEGKLIRLSDVAQVRLDATINAINHENAERLITVQHNISNRALGDVVADVQKAIKPIEEKMLKMQNYHLKISGQYEAQQSASKYMFYLGIVSMILMITILYLHFKSLNLLFQSLFCIPMSLIGATIFIYLTNQTFSIATWVGIIAMIGVAASNAILLLDHYTYLMKNEKMKCNLEMLIKGGLERMTPVFMTALTSGIALVPLILNANEPGKEILYPVASVIIGGLISCTFFDFTLRPALYYLLRVKSTR